MLLGLSAWIHKTSQTLQNTESILKTNIFEYPKPRRWRQFKKSAVEHGSYTFQCIEKCVH